MFAPRRLDQSIARVIEIVIDRLHHLVPVVDRLLCVITYPSDVACGIVGVMKVLKHRGGWGKQKPHQAPEQAVSRRLAGTHHPDEAEGFFVMAILSPCAVAVLNKGA